MKKNKLTVIGLAFAGLLLAACDAKPTPSTSTSAGTSDSASASSSAVEPDLRNADLARGKLTYTDENGQEKNLTRSRIYAASGAPHVDSRPATGVKQKLLVAPIKFQKDPTDAKDTIEANDELLAKINLSFVGDDEALKTVAGAEIYSVKSFYEKSSFGKGAFDVVVLPCWIEYNGTAKAFQTSASNQGGGVAMSNYVKSWYATEYAKAGHGALGADWQYKWSDFDSDKDGYLDLIWQVYAYPYTEHDTSFWWAYVTYTGNQKNVADPNIMTLAWASTNFMSKFNGYDTHTFIHETGHTLGVNDYYDYNNAWKPMGGVDFMDHNLGDHGAYTKFMYGWVEPYVLREEDLADDKVAEITLRAQTTSGDCLVLASPDYNGTAYDEYFMVELVGPYGICERDYKSGYESTKGFTKPGLRITHVDGRMYQRDHDTYIKDPNELGRNGGDFRVSNSYGGRNNMRDDQDWWPNEDGSVKKWFCEQHLMESNLDAQNNCLTSPQYSATNGTLFVKNQRFTLTNNSGWAKTFMPSGTNLWNKAKTITGWNGTSKQKFTIDENCTCNFYLKVKDIVTDPTYGAIATITVNLAK
ncbi:MAG: hypothetical protein MJ228_00020 [Bacilli bacterium]|nr:hypothetical protein [Bacilli bacterium]